MTFVTMILPEAYAMKVSYLLAIENPSSHQVRVTVRLSRGPGQKQLSLFLPRWSPGSYLIREYSRNLRSLRAIQANGEDLWIEKDGPSVWKIDWDKSILKQQLMDFEVSYTVYCHEVSVRTSWIDSEHAFLHLPTLLMAVVGAQMPRPELELRFPPLWSKISTSLDDISTKREIFLYSALDYDTLIDSPIEIGCHDTDGFLINGVPHEMATFGLPFPSGRSLKDDMKKICLTVVEFWGGSLPFERYTFITHFLSGIYGGLEHGNSTALHFDCGALGKREEYVEFLGLVCHEYTHAWNGKRLRPQGLGPFDYLKEASTSMLWLVEGLTSYLDDLLVLRSGLTTLDEYNSTLKKSLVRFERTPGRYQQTLSEAGSEAWTVHYRPDENTSNSAISYYLKGKLAFLFLHLSLFEQNIPFQTLIRKWWDLYLAHPEEGVSEGEIFSVLTSVAGQKTSDQFWKILHTTEDIPLANTLMAVGLELKYAPLARQDWGVEWKTQGERLLISVVRRDGAAFRSGLNAGDEILFVGGRRVLAADSAELAQWCQVDRPYQVLISRQGRFLEKTLTLNSGEQELSSLAMRDRSLWEKFLLS